MTLAILSALAEEQQGLRAQLECVQEHRVGSRSFTTGQIHGYPIILARSGIGKVAASATAAVLCSHFHIKGVLFSGVAGSVHNDVDVGDVVVGRQYVQHDMDAAPLFPRWEIPLYGTSRFSACAHLHGLALASAQHALRGTRRDDGDMARVHSGLILSGDQFIGSSLVRARLQTEHPTALAAEMEGAAVAQVCSDFGVPFVAVRQVSDRAGETAHDDFASFLQQRTAPFVEHFFPHFIAGYLS